MRSSDVSSLLLIVIRRLYECLWSFPILSERLRERWEDISSIQIRYENDNKRKTQTWIVMIGSKIPHYFLCQSTFLLIRSEETCTRFPALFFRPVFPSNSIGSLDCLFLWLLAKVITLVLLHPTEELCPLHLQASWIYTWPAAGVQEANR